MSFICRKADPGRSVPKANERPVKCVFFDADICDNGVPHRGQPLFFLILLYLYVVVLHDKRAFETEVTELLLHYAIQP